MTPERHKQIKAIFLEALEAGERGAGGGGWEAVIIKRCEGDADLEREVRALLEHHTDIDPKLAEPELRRIASQPQIALPDEQAPAGPDAEAPKDADASRGPSPSRSSLKMDRGRFAPGTTIARRYRIVNLIARGGMGEVYRADDLKLAEPVALKFLPSRFADDKQWLDRFLDEVRVARNVSHPNVCRVYDVGEDLGEHFLTMEFVEGETLSSLQSRIGRLPPRKAEQLAQQLCGGLAAIHDEGILHRDLKPSNILIDDKGQAKITDFGLAAPGELRGRHAAAGTPGYIAPESLHGIEATVRSDIYQLGLVLYELFAGRPAYVSEDGEDLILVQQKTDPVPPSTFAPDIKQSVEQVIMRCLERDPDARPATVRQVARMLPGGGDPLAAALAAGQTPSPSLVAMSGGKSRMQPAAAAVALVLFAALVALGIWIGGRGMSLIRIVPLDKSPQALAENARSILASLGYNISGDEDTSGEGGMRPASGHEAWGWDLSTELLAEIERSDQSPTRWARLKRDRPPAIEFWYRWSPEPLVPRRPTGIVTPDDPPQSVPGMITLRLTPHGRLHELTVLDQRTNWPVDPKTGLAPGAAGPPLPAIDWAKVFETADLDIRKFLPVDKERIPPVFADDRQAWTGFYPEKGGQDTPIRVEAATVGHRLVAFRTIETDLPMYQANRAPAETRSGLIGTYGRNAIIALTLIGAGILAWRNTASKRGDRSGAFRMALTVGVATPVMLLLEATTLRSDATSGMFSFLGNLVWMLSLGAGSGLGVWVLYIAVEPYVRRLWPESIISWTRLVYGRIYDPLVGQSLLAGALGGAITLPIIYLTRLVPGWVGHAPAAPYFSRRIEAGMLDGTRQALGHIVENGLQGLQRAMLMLVGIVLIKLIVRKTWLALIIFGVLQSLAFALERPTVQDWTWAIMSITWAIYATLILAWLLLLVRYGVLALIAGTSVAGVLGSLPITMDLEKWYSGIGMLGLVLVCAVPLYGAAAAVGGRTRSV
ncbi:MAG TPA: serine/threonine-protein kinase [Phycisphaerales bacterium]|nr:serine/threonine-protein kinase [Phycisphaerales bacterium]